MARQGIIERIARASAGRPWLTIGAWGAALIAAILVVALLSGSLSASDSFVHDPESKRAERLIEEKLPGATQDTEIVVMRSAARTVNDPAFEHEVQALKREILSAASGDVTWVATYYDAIAVGAEEAELLVSADGRTTIILVTLAANGDDAAEHVAGVYDAVQSARDRLEPHGFSVAITGNGTWEHEAHPLAGNDLMRGEMIGVPIALVVLVFVFGALVAAGIPFALALVAIVAALASISLLAQGFMLSMFAANVVTMMGLAVGIDYALFILSRFREERAAGNAVVDAIGRAAATSSRAVLFSGITVVLALTGMLMIPFSIFMSMGIGMILVVVYAVAAALTLLPAVLALLGDRVDAVRVPFRRLQAAPRSEGRWGRWVRVLLRRPAVTLAIGAVILIGLAVPGLGLQRGEAGASDMPAHLSARQGYEMLREDFSAGLTSPVLVAVEGDQTDPQVLSGVAALGDAAEADGRFQVLDYEQSPGNDLGVVTITLVGSAAEASAEAGAVRDLRDSIIPAAFDAAPVDILVGGGPASVADMEGILDTMTPIVFAVVLALSFLLLLLVFRSIVIAAIAVVMNLLSVGAAYGLLTLVFQHGILADLLGFQQTPTITTWVPLLLFCVLFGLSMDYQVFLLSRVREHYDRVGDTREAVVFGVSSTAGIITGAALIMVAVFGGMASGDLVMFQQIGFGLAVAVALDATVVRTLVMPATMALLGRANWYLPRWLEWLPGVQIEAEGPRNGEVHADDPVRPAGGPALGPTESPADGSTGDDVGV